MTQPTTSRGRDGSAANMLIGTLVALLLLLGIGLPLVVRLGWVEPTMFGAPPPGVMAPGGAAAVPNRHQIRAAAEYYRRTEGHAARGTAFQHLSIQLELHARGGAIPLKHEDVVATLGPPDLISTDAAAGQQWAYFYSQPQRRDWCVLLYFTPNGSLTAFTHSQRAAVDLSGWQPFVAPPATAPADEQDTDDGDPPHGP